GRRHGGNKERGRRHGANKARRRRHGANKARRRRHGGFGHANSTFSKATGAVRTARDETNVEF
ncbi:MAG: hypothetical protein FWJ61_06025, partial [Limnochordales bacterium]